MSEVTDLLERLAAGTTTLDDAVRDFETRTWPTPRTDEERQASAIANDDPEPVQENSFAEVASAYVDGEIDDEQYAALAHAAAAAMGGGDQPPQDATADPATPDPAAAPAAPPAPAGPQPPEVAQTR